MVPPRQPFSTLANPGLSGPEIFITVGAVSPVLPTNQPLPRHSLGCIGCGWYSHQDCAAVLVEKCPQIGGAVMSPIFQMGPN